MMNAEQKERAIQLITTWRTRSITTRPDESAVYGDCMTDILQELVDAPEPEPVARVTGYYAGYLSIATVDGRVLHAGTALYLAPPAPSVPDGWKLVPVEPTPEPFGYFKAEPFGWTDCAETDDGAIALFAAPPAPSVPDNVAAEPVGYLYTNLQSGEYHVSDADDDYRGPERVLWCIEPVYRRTAKGQS